jgi:SWI/SNF-related matrix-associated actin-dependent regulator 1 of chromatin subfamily A
MSSEHKQQSVDRFQRDPKCKLFVGSITAAGVGITLTAASYVLFAELDWRPAMVAQAEDRLHRIGQKESVLVQHVVFDGSLDANMAKKIVEKQEIIDKAIG